MRDATFELAVDMTLEFEGVDSDHADDPGGRTRFGWSLRTLRAKGFDIDGDGDVDADDVAALTRDEARELYRQEFYERPGIDRLPSYVGVAAFDFAVNAGPGRAIRELQAAVNELRREASPIAEDGVIGPNTLMAIGALTVTLEAEELLVKTYILRRVRFHADLAKSPKLRTFLRGWTMRCCELSSRLFT